MFAIQLAILFFASKAEYGRFSLAMSYVVMGQALFSTFFGPPLITTLVSLPEGSRAEASNVAMQWQLRASLATVLVLIPPLVMLVPGFRWELALPAALAFIGLAYRDVQRVTWTVELKMWSALVNTCLFAVVVTVLLLALVALRRHVGAAEGLAAIAFAVLSTNVGRLGQILIARRRTPQWLGSRLRALALWSVPGAIVIWIQNNLYLTIIAVYMSLTAVGEISAARLLAVPYLLAASGLLRVAQVRFGELLRKGEMREVRRTVRNWVATHLAAGSCIAVTLAGVGAIGGAAVAPAKYPHLFHLAACWFLFAGAATARSSVSSLFQAMGRYKVIFLATSLAVPIVLGGIALLVPRIGLSGAILPMVAGELLLLATLSAILMLQPARIMAHSPTA